MCSATITPWAIPIDIFGNRIPITPPTRPPHNDNVINITLNTFIDGSKKNITCLE